MDWERARRWLEGLLASEDRADPVAGRVRIVLERGRPPRVIGPSEASGGGRTLRVQVIGPSTPVVVRPAPAITIVPPPRAAWDERGWLERADGKGRVYEGRYMARARSGQIATFPGRIVVRGGSVTPYIADPPPQIRNHRKGPCFQLTRAPWFRVHWRRPADNVDDALLYVERVLSEVLN